MNDNVPFPAVFNDVSLAVCQLRTLGWDVKIYFQVYISYFQILDGVFHPSVLDNDQKNEFSRSNKDVQKRKSCIKLRWVRMSGDIDINYPI